MSVTINRFCINRKTAPALGIEAFFRLVNNSGLNKVELRNDMIGGKVTDNLSPSQVRKLAENYEIEILTINAVYPFNQLTEKVLILTESLLNDAKAVGAKSLVLCPLNDGSTISPQETLDAMQKLAPLFETYGITGLVEPLGFSQSSLRSAAQVQGLIRDAGVPFKILIDTFHHHLYPDAEAEFSQVDINSIGLVHLSGVEDTRPREELTDAERIMLTPLDRLLTCKQIKRLEDSGYQGVYAFEPFAPQLCEWNEKRIQHEIETSIRMIQNFLEGNNTQTLST